VPDRSLDSLSAACYVKACEWIARITARGVAVKILQTSRTLAEHQANLAAGTSGTSLSLHLPRSARARTLDGLSPMTDLDKADALDLAPYEIYQLSGSDKLQWDAGHPAWAIIGEECERVGLRWGGRWRTPFDPGHGELILPAKAHLVVAERARPWPTFRTA